MFIVLHCMGIPFDGETIQHKSLGGSETAAYYAAKELAAKGHEVTIFTNTDKESKSDGVRYIPCGKITEQSPLGEMFHFYATNTLIDVLIIQRHPQAFSYPWSAKIKLWWVHDLAIHRQAAKVRNMLWNIDGILTVSEFHKQQYAEVYGINPDIIYPIQNGIDLSLFGSEYVEEIDSPSDVKGGYEGMQKRFRVLYTSRPERGLEHLVMPNGIMERLFAQVPDAHLYVCGYDNTTEQMAPYYEYLWERCGQLPNVTNLGSLTKQELADVMCQCDLLVYPTPGPQQPNFEEVSCITAMEAMAAGLPMLTSNKGALPETCKDSGVVLLDVNERGMPELDKFVGEIVALYYDVDRRNELGEQQHFAATKFEWKHAATMIEDVVRSCFVADRSIGAVMRGLIRDSDIYAVKHLTDHTPISYSPIALAAEQEMNECYDFALNEKPYFEEHYKSVYEREAERGVNYGPENLDGNDRFEGVSGIIGSLDPGSVVLDYGCAHGHYTVNLAKRFPDKRFIGVDITKSNVEKARAWAESEKLDNIEFIHGSFEDENFTLDGIMGDGFTGFDAIIAAEVIEHVDDPRRYVEELHGYLAEQGKMIITVPFGPWEAQGYEEHWPWRAHLWHFERTDLHELWGHMRNYSLLVVPAGRGKEGTILGSHIVMFDKTPNTTQGEINFERKMMEAKPRQTVSLCMIAKDAEDCIKRALDSVVDVVDEIIICIDNTTTDSTRAIVDKFRKDRKGLWPIVHTKEILSPLEIGFDEARNLSIVEADGDWVLWMDTDEIMINAENMRKYLQNNQFNGYAIKQHHFSVEPLGVLKTDLPCRLFRNHKGVKFFGVVHEHPEVELNKGVGYVQLIQDVEIAHHGYTTENIRRKRFDRNIDLMLRDRQKYPERYLGKFLWVRDLSQMCRYEMELNGGYVTETMIQRAKDGIKLWEELLEDNQLRMLIDGIDFYSMLARILDTGFEAGFMVETSKSNGGVHMENAVPIHGYFASRNHLDKLMAKLVDAKIENYESKYF